MSESLKVSVIIPTKHRPEALGRVVQSIAAQTVPARTLIIVDQSEDDRSRQRVEKELRSLTSQDRPTLELQYIHDASIVGAAMARNRAMETACDDIWLFLDDDVVLEPTFIQEIQNVYRADHGVDGVSGIITNYPRPPRGSYYWNAVFMLGPFHDERQPIYWQADALRDSPPVAATRFGCGLMSFRKSVLRGLTFDQNLDTNLKGVSDGEDVDLCLRLPSGSKLLIAPRARLAHYHDPAGRLLDHWLRRHSRANVFLFLKHWNAGISNKLLYRWLWIGYLLAALAASLKRMSAEPWRALRAGAQEGRAAFASAGKIASTNARGTRPGVHARRPERDGSIRDHAREP